MQTQEGGIVLFRILDIRLMDNLVVTLINCNSGYDFSIIKSTSSNYPTTTGILALYHQKHDEPKIKREHSFIRGEESKLEARFSVEGGKSVDISSRRRGKRARKKVISGVRSLRARSFQGDLASNRLAGTTSRSWQFYSYSSKCSFTNRHSEKKCYTCCAQPVRVAEAAT